MAEYRVYFFDAQKHINRPPAVIKCDDDQQAIREAERMVDGQDVELWQQARLVVRLPAKP